VKRNLSRFLLPTLLILAAGCAARLAPGGPYSDPVLYRAHEATTSGADLLRDFVRWELKYRDELASVPQARQLADTIRENAKGWTKSAILLADAYEASPTEANRSSLQAAVDSLSSAINSALEIMKANAPNAPKQNKT